MLRVDSAQFSLSKVARGELVMILIRGSDLAASGWELALQDPRKRQFLDADGWHADPVWHKPKLMKGGGTSLDMTLHNDLSNAVGRTSEYRLHLRKNLAPSTFEIDTMVCWAAPMQAPSYAPASAISTRPMVMGGAAVAALVILGSVMAYVHSSKQLPDDSPRDIRVRETKPNDEPARTIVEEHRGLDAARSSPEQLKVRALEGDSAAAFELATLYDPALGQSLEGLEKNPRYAFTWYSKADDLGYPDVGTRIESLRTWIQNEIDAGSTDLGPLFRLIESTN